MHGLHTRGLLLRLDKTKNRFANQFAMLAALFIVLIGVPLHMSIQVLSLRARLIPGYYITFIDHSHRQKNNLRLRLCSPPMYSRSRPTLEQRA